MTAVGIWLLKSPKVRTRLLKEAKKATMLRPCPCNPTWTLLRARDSLKAQE